MTLRTCCILVTLFASPATSLAIFAQRRSTDGPNVSQHRLHAHGTSCSICHLSPASAPALYAAFRHDGLGEVVTSIIFDMAWAAYLGLNFLGVYDMEPGLFFNNHGIDIQSSTAEFFSLQDKSEVFVPKSKHVNERPRTVLVSKMLELEDAVKTAPVRTKQFIVAEGISSLHVHFVPTDPLTPRFLSALRQQVQPFLDRRLAKRSFFRRGPGSGPQVALHLRRGDIVEKRRPCWWTPNEWYYDIVGHIRAALPSASIHLFSESFSDEDGSQFDGFQDLAPVNDEFYEHFRRLNLPIHLNDDVLDVWAHFASADIFVTAKSAFSEVPAFINPNCVIFNNYYDNNMRPSFKEWLVVGTNASDVSLRDRLRDCVRQRLPQYKLAE